MSPARVARTGDGTPTQLRVERCPWCDQPISHEKFQQIRSRIQAEERQHAAEIAAEAKTQVEKARKEAAVVLEKAKRMAKLQADAARDEGKRAALAEMTSKLAEV